MTDIWNLIAQRLEESTPTCVATLLASASPGRNVGDKALFGLEGFLTGVPWLQQDAELTDLTADALQQRRTGPVSLGDGSRLFLDVLLEQPHLLICGAGHIAVPLARYASESGFSVTVLDDRTDFARADRFPGPACKVVCEDFTAALSTLELGSDAYVVVITRGHEHDVDCLRSILPKPTRYIGMIGSKRRVTFVRQMLRQEGIAPERLEELFSPIGLPIGAESPEEIALSITAELVGVRRKGPEYTRTLRDGDSRKVAQ